MAGPKAGEENRLPSEKVFVLSNRSRDPHCILNQEMMGPTVERDFMKRFNCALGVL